MRVLLTLAVLIPVSVTAQDRFAPDNPWFQDFEAACRVEAGMNEECQAGVLGAYAEYAGTDDIRCDFTAFWRVRDGLGDTISVLPWQYGVEHIVQTEGVCSVL